MAIKDQHSSKALAMYEGQSSKVMQIIALKNQIFENKTQFLVFFKLASSQKIYLLLLVYTCLTTCMFTLKEEL